MNKEELKKAVLAEVAKLRKHATTEELAKLLPSLINPNSVENCIYGTMTGHCRNSRAVFLLNKCTKPYSSSIDGRGKVEPEVMCFYQEIVFIEQFSPIEFYIVQPWANIDGLCDIMRGTPVENFTFEKPGYE